MHYILILIQKSSVLDSLRDIDNTITNYTQQVLPFTWFIGGALYHHPEIMALRGKTVIKGKARPRVLKYFHKLRS